MITTTFAWDEHSRSMRIGKLPPGPYEALVWDRTSWTCGYVDGLSVTPNGVANATVHLVPGVRVRISDLTGSASLATALSLRAAGVPDLPAIDQISAANSQTYGVEYPAPPDVVLAPLPFDEIWASFQPAEGERKEILVRATSPK